MEIPLSKNRLEILRRLDHRVLDDGYAIVDRFERRIQHATVRDQP